MPDLSTKLRGNGAAWTWFSGTQAPGNHTLEIINNVHAASFLGLFIYASAPASPGAGDTLTLAVTNRPVPQLTTVWFPWVVFNLIGGAAAPPPRYELIEAVQTQNGNGALVTHTNLTAALTAGQDNVGTAAGDWFPVGDLRGEVTITGVQNFTYQVVVFAAGF